MLCDIRGSHILWEQRSVVFDWCEERFGKYELGGWVFKYSHEQSYGPKYLHILLDEEDTAAFLLKWGDNAWVNQRWT